MTNFFRFKQFIDTIDWKKLKRIAEVPYEIKYFNPEIKLHEIHEEEFLENDFLRIPKILTEKDICYCNEIEDDDETEVIITINISNVLIVQCNKDKFLIGLTVVREDTYYDNYKEKEILFYGYWNGNEWIKNTRIEGENYDCI